MKQKTICAVCIFAVWAVLTGFAWFTPAEAVSEAERRPLAQLPEFTSQALLDGSFMSKFESYSLDQFPLRDRFRQLKALFHYNVLGQKDNNDIYIADGFAVKQEYPLNPGSVEHALQRFNYLYNKLLKDNTGMIVLAVAPDKGYYLGNDSGHLTMDYEAMFEALETGMPWAEPVDLTAHLNGDAYYRTDTHWRQEALLPAAGAICEALGVTAPEAADFTEAALKRPFYGVYYGQAALPMDPETMYVLESDLLADCTVYDYESGKYAEVYDMGKLESRDLYDVFLSGSRSLLTIENPHGTPGKELLVFRDSFASSMVPLLVQDYAKVTLIDIRYIQIDVLDRFIPISGQDVLFLYSTLVLNNSETIK